MTELQQAAHSQPDQGLEPSADTAEPVSASPDNWAEIQDADCDMRIPDLQHASPPSPPVTSPAPADSALGHVSCLKASAGSDPQVGAVPGDLQPHGAVLSLGSPSAAYGTASPGNLKPPEAVLSPAVEPKDTAGCGKAGSETTRARRVTRTRSSEETLVAGIDVDPTSTAGKKHARLQRLPRKAPKEPLVLAASETDPPVHTPDACDNEEGEAAHGVSLEERNTSSTVPAGMASRLSAANLLPATGTVTNNGLGSSVLPGTSPAAPLADGGKSCGAVVEAGQCKPAAGGGIPHEATPGAVAPDSQQESDLPCKAALSGAMEIDVDRGAAQPAVEQPVKLAAHAKSMSQVQGDVHEVAQALKVRRCRHLIACR